MLFRLHASASFLIDVLFPFTSLQPSQAVVFPLHSKLFALSPQLLSRTILPSDFLQLLSRFSFKPPSLMSIYLDLPFRLRFLRSDFFCFLVQRVHPSWKYNASLKLTIEIFERVDLLIDWNKDEISVVFERRQRSREEKLQ